MLIMNMQDNLACANSEEKCRVVDDGVDSAHFFLAEIHVVKCDEVAFQLRYR